MKAGTHTFPILVTDVSGSPVNGLASYEFVVGGQVGTTLIDTGTITSSLSADGYYMAAVSLPVGQGFLTVSPTATALSVTPSFYEIDSTLYDVDDTYAAIARQSLDITQTAVSSYESQSIGPYKEGDTWIITYVVPDAVAPSISGWSNFKASLFDDSILTSVTGAGFIGNFTLAVNTVTKTVVMTLAASSTSQIIAEGNTEEYFYSDLQATDDSGNNRTIAELSILARRNFTRP